MNTPTQKIATPADVANTVRYLASEASGHITGTYNPVCGGAYLPQSTGSRPAAGLEISGRHRSGSGFPLEECPCPPSLP